MSKFIIEYDETGSDCGRGQGWILYSEESEMSTTTFPSSQDYESSTIQTVSVSTLAQYPYPD